MNIHQFIQVAGVIDQEEADLLVNAGVEFLGFPLRLPVNREDLSEEEAAKIIRNLPSEAHGVLICYLDSANEIIQFCDKLGTRMIQLHGEVAGDELRRVKSERDDIVILKSLVTGLHSRDELRQIISTTHRYVDGYITDTFDPETGASGATGLVHDWSLSRELVEASPRPVILAGGLHAGNVKAAIEAVGPAGVDAHTGLEGADGRKDRDKVKQFVEEAREGFRSVARYDS